jgi:hypothetical protein
MIPDGASSRGDLWRRVRREAETAMARDPIFGRTLSAAILDRRDLRAALSHQIGQRLGIVIGAVVTRDVPDGCTAVGVPARLTNCQEAVST